MMKVKKHRSFKKYFKKLSRKHRMTFNERIALFIADPRNPILRVHCLHGDMQGYYAFSITGDLRVIFEWPTENQIILVKIGTHNQVY